MEKNKPAEFEYHIYSFMKRLKLKKSELIVYAALYSFTIGERGLYHGSQKYLAGGLGICVRTLQTAQKKLFSLGLIERYATADGRYVGIRCKTVSKDEPVTKPLAQKSEDSKSAIPSENSSVFKNSAAEDIGAKVFLLERLGKNPTEQEKNTFLMMYKYEKDGDNRRFMRFGREGLVSMTEPQYRRLLDILPTEELLPYFSKLENMIKENMNTGRAGPHSHYKTLKKWIESDLAV